MAENFHSCKSGDCSNVPKKGLKRGNGRGAGGSTESQKKTGSWAENSKRGSFKMVRKNIAGTKINKVTCSKGIGQVNAQGRWGGNNNSDN